MFNSYFIPYNLHIHQSMQLTSLMCSVQGMRVQGLSVWRESAPPNTTYPWASAAQFARVTTLTDSTKLNNNMLVP